MTKFVRNPQYITNYMFKSTHYSKFTSSDCAPATTLNLTRYWMITGRESYHQFYIFFCFLWLPSVRLIFERSEKPKSLLCPAFLGQTQTDWACNHWGFSCCNNKQGLRWSHIWKKLTHSRGESKGNKIIQYQLGTYLSWRQSSQILMVQIIPKWHRQKNKLPYHSCCTRLSAVVTTQPAESISHVVRWNCQLYLKCLGANYSVNLYGLHKITLAVKWSQGNSDCITE